MHCHCRAAARLRHQRRGGAALQGGRLRLFRHLRPNSVIPAVEKAFPGKGDRVHQGLAGKQFEYGFLRSITDRHADFFKVTEDALVYTAEAMKLALPPETRAASARRLPDAQALAG